MNPYDWVLEGRTALYIRGSLRRNVYITHSRLLLNGHREYLCHAADGPGIETFEAGSKDLRWMS